MPLTARGLEHQYPGGPVLFAGLDLDLHPGVLAALTGPSGSGKSTLLAILAGWLHPTAGTVDRSGCLTTSWVLQNPHGQPRRRAVDHVVYPLLARGWRRDCAQEQAAGILAEFGIAEVAARPFRDLSGGEAQRLMLARAVARAPDLMLVDEPTAQLDRATAATVNTHLGSLAGRGIVVVVATHDTQTRDACDTVIDLARSLG